jgi:hypothetical protein
MATCKKCGTNFFRTAEESWKTLCIPCFKEKRRAEASYFTLWQRATAEADRLAEALETLERQLTVPSALERELRKQLPRLIQLCHPDRHGGSEASNHATAWLLSVKRSLEVRP